MSGRTIIVGDVHGCLRELDKLIAAVGPGPLDEFIFLGDLIHKGPDSLGVLRRVAELPARSVIGNHELRLIRHRRDPSEFFAKPIDHALMARMTPRDWTVIEDMVPTVELPEFSVVAVHGGFLPFKPWRRQALEVITRIQVIDPGGQPRKRSEAPGSPPWVEAWRGPELVIYGHTPRPQVHRRPHSFGIDTGCVYGGRLTAYILPDRSFCQVPARTCYTRGVPPSFARQP